MSAGVSFCFCLTCCRILYWFWLCVLAYIGKVEKALHARVPTSSIFCLLLEQSSYIYAVVSLLSDSVLLPAKFAINCSIVYASLSIRTTMNQFLSGPFRALHLNYVACSFLVPLCISMIRCNALDPPDCIPFQVDRFQIVVVVIHTSSLIGRVFPLRPLLHAPPSRTFPMHTIRSFAHICTHSPYPFFHILSYFNS